jgi:hypothetical protein
MGCETKEDYGTTEVVPLDLFDDELFEDYEDIASLIDLPLEEH